MSVFRPTPGKLIALGLLAGGLFLAAQTVTITLSDSSYDSNTALSWRPRSAAALSWAAEDRMSSSEGERGFEEVVELAQRALLVSPLDLDALRTLGLIASERGLRDRAEPILADVARRAPRDPRAQAWMFQAKLQRNDYEGALSHLDAVLRTRPNLFPDLAPVLLSFAADPAAFQALASYLRTNPPWRGSLMTALPAGTDDPEGLYPLYASLLDGPTPPPSGELAPFLNRLIKDGKIDQAFLFWLQFLPEERRSDVTALYNGHFDYPVTGLPFDWQLGQVRGAETQVAATGDGGQQALRIRFIGRRVPFQHVSHFLSLGPGEYELEGQVRPVALETPRGMQWVILCGKQELGASELMSGSSAWTDFSFRFSVPPDPACQGQTLQLRLAARVASEQQIAGEVWFDNLSIARLTP